MLLGVIRSQPRRSLAAPLKARPFSPGVRSNCILLIRPLAIFIWWEKHSSKQGGHRSVEMRRKKAGYPIFPDRTRVNTNLNKATAQGSNGFLRDIVFILGTEQAEVHRGTGKGWSETETDGWRK